MIRFTRPRLAAAAAAAAGTAAAAYTLAPQPLQAQAPPHKLARTASVISPASGGAFDGSWSPLPREEVVKNLKTKEYDVLVIGGGATGTGVAMDAATRGLNIALVERDDFASGERAALREAARAGRGSWGVPPAPFRLAGGRPHHSPPAHHERGVPLAHMAD